jgi:transposase-like protein
MFESLLVAVRVQRLRNKAVKTVLENWKRLTTYYDFPREQWKYLSTSQLVEWPFSRVRACAQGPRENENRRSQLGTPPKSFYPLLDKGS